MKSGHKIRIFVEPDFCLGSFFPTLYPASRKSSCLWLVVSLITPHKCYIVPSAKKKPLQLFFKNRKGFL